MIDNAAWRIQHALSYPFDPPDCSYLFSGGEMHDISAAHYDDRTPVLASGSNGSPARLREKYGTENDIPVTRIRMRQLIAAYAARITSYGSVPATLAPATLAPATIWQSDQHQETITHCTWLTADQLDIMHQTESVGTGYAYCAVSPDYCSAIDGPHPGAPTAYISLSGYLPDGQGHAMSLRHHDQSAAQLRVREIIAPDHGQDTFIATNILNAEHRANMNSLLQPIGVAIKHASLSRLI